MAATSASSLEISDLKISNLLPGRGLAPDIEKWITDGLIAALPNLRMSSLFAIRRDMFTAADLITLAAEPVRGTVIGALSSRWCTPAAGRRFLHILTQFVGEPYQGSAMFARSWGSHFQQLYTRWSQFPDLFVLKTYNPIVYCAMRAFTRVPGVTFYPDVHAGRPDARAARAAAEVAELIAPEHAFVPDTGIIRGAGEPADLYPWLPRSRNKKVNDYFAATCLPGDRMLCMLNVPTPEAAGMILGAFGVAPATPRIRMARSGIAEITARRTADRDSQ